MKGLETGKDKIQKICDELRKETLEPAKQEAREIVENSHIQASEVIKDAEKKAERLVQLAKEEIVERQKVFQSSLQIACRQGVDLLKQKIEEQLFDKELADLVVQDTTDPKIIASLIESMIHSMEEKGVEEEFVALIPKGLSPRSINALIGARVLARLKNQTVSLGDFMGGVQIQLKGSRVTIDISDAAVKELIAQYIRRDFREMIYST